MNSESPGERSAVSEPRKSPRPANSGNEKFEKSRGQADLDAETETLRVDDLGRVPSARPHPPASTSSAPSSGAAANPLLTWQIHPQQPQLQFQPHPSRARTDHAEPPDVLTEAWRYRWWVGGATIVVALLTLTVSLLLPSNYESSADIRFSLIGQPGSAVSDTVEGSNDLAAQYASDITSDSVIVPAAGAAGVDADGLRARTAGGTVAGQNILQVTVQDGDPAEAARQAQAVADSLVRYVLDQSTGQAATYEQNLAAQLVPLDQQIEEARGEVDAALGLPAEQRTATQSRLTTLLDRRAQLIGQGALQGASLIPRVEVSTAAAPGIRVSPQPLLYTVVAGTVALFVATQGAVLVARRGRDR